MLRNLLHNNDLVEFNQDIGIQGGVILANYSVSV